MVTRKVLIIPLSKNVISSNLLDRFSELFCIKPVNFILIDLKKSKLLTYLSVAMVTKFPWQPTILDASSTFKVKISIQRPVINKLE